MEHEENVSAFNGKPPKPVKRKNDSQQPLEFVQAPANLVGIRVGKRLRVQHEFVSDETCPLGPGKRCKVVEGGYMVIENDKQGPVWVRLPGYANKN